MEQEHMQETLEFWVEQAKEGDQVALEAVVRGIQDRVYGLALRMLWHPARCGRCLPGDSDQSADAFE